MLHKRIYLDESCDRVFIDTYIADDRSIVRDAMLVIPGGGYGMICADREGEPIALAFLAQGMNAFVLGYRVGEGDRYPAQLIDATRAILYIREHADELGIDRSRVFAVGFSAGGHLAGSLAILHKEKAVLDTLGIKAGQGRPDAAILAYPVVSASLSTHGTSFKNLLGKELAKLTEDEKRAVSLECNVDGDSAPLFIWHTSRDEIVPPMGSLALAGAYLERGLNVMLHLYPYGTHGVALGNEVTRCGNDNWIQPLAEGWVESACKWLKSLN